MTSVRDLILSEFRHRGCAYWDLYPDFYLASIGAHMFNLHNIRNHILYESGRLYNTRLHLIFISPPGFSKSFWLDQFMHHESGIIGSALKTTFEATMTEAGLIGSIRNSGERTEETSGVAKRHKLSIIGIEEFSALRVMMEAQHSKGLDTALLTSLDSGRVRKSLAGGEISYNTFYSLWAGVQPARFDLTSGLGRRFCFIEFLPTSADREIMKTKRRGAMNVRFNPALTDNIRDQLRITRGMIGTIERIVFDKTLYKMFDNLKLAHFEEMLFERLALGYTLMAYPIRTKMTIKMDKTLGTMMEKEAKWRRSVSRGSQFSEVITVLVDNGGSMTMSGLKDELVLFGLDWNQSMEIINQMVRARLVTVKGGVVEVKKDRW